VRLTLSLIAVIGVIVLALLTASLLGIVQPNCDHLPLNNRVGQCYVDPSAPIRGATPAPSLIGLLPTLR